MHSQGLSDLSCRHLPPLQCNHKVEADEDEAAVVAVAAGDAPLPPPLEQGVRLLILRRSHTWWSSQARAVCADAVRRNRQCHRPQREQPAPQECRRKNDAKNPGVPHTPFVMEQWKRRQYGRRPPPRRCLGHRRVPLSTRQAPSAAPARQGRITMVAPSLRVTEGGRATLPPDRPDDPPRYDRPPPP